MTETLEAVLTAGGRLAERGLSGCHAMCDVSQAYNFKAADASGNLPNRPETTRQLTACRPRHRLREARGLLVYVLLPGLSLRITDKKSTLESLTKKW